MEKKRDSFFLSEKKNKNIKNGKSGDKEFKQKRQDKFNETRNGVAQQEEKKDKKPFDKKTYRLKKYSKKYKLDQWEEKRKKNVLRKYYKDVQPTEVPGSYTTKQFDEDITDGNQHVGKYVRHPDIIEKEDTANKPLQNKKSDPFLKAKERFDKIKMAKLDKQKEVERAREERKQKLQEYKKKKHEKFKKLSKKNKKGQPMMTGRMELLLEKIQNGS